MSTQLKISTPAEFSRWLERSKGSIANALPKHLNPDRMLRIAVTCFSTTPALRECSPTSILGSVIVASQLGLEPGIAGQGYLIPYKGTCTFVPGWQGLVGLLNNTGRATCWTGSVFAGDEFDFQLGSSPRLVHRPGDHYGDSDKLIGVYACAQVNGSQMPVVEYWPMSRVMKHRDKFNKVGGKHYSFLHPEMYARKVVLLQVLKYMPRSIELQNALVAVEAAEKGGSSKVEGGVVVEVASEVVEAEASQGPAMFHAPAPATAAAVQPERAAPRPADAAKTDQEFALADSPPPPREALAAKMIEAGISEWEVLDACKLNKIAVKATLAETAEAVIVMLADEWENVAEVVTTKIRTKKGGAK